MKKTPQQLGNTPEARQKMISSFSYIIDQLADSIFSIGYQQNHLKREMPLKVFFLVYNHLIAVLTGKRGRSKEIYQYFKKRDLIIEDSYGKSLYIYQTREFHEICLLKADKITKILKQLKKHAHTPLVSSVIHSATTKTLREYYQSMPAHGGRELDAHFVLNELIDIGISFMSFLSETDQDRPFFHLYPDFMANICSDEIGEYDVSKQYAGIIPNGELINTYTLPYLIECIEHLQHERSRKTLHDIDLKQVFEHLIGASEGFFNANFIHLINQLILFTAKGNISKIHWKKEIIQEKQTLYAPEGMMYFVKVMILRYLSMEKTVDNTQNAYIMDALQIYPDDFDVFSKTSGFEKIGSVILRGGTSFPLESNSTKKHKPSPKIKKNKPLSPISSVASISSNQTLFSTHSSISSHHPPVETTPWLKRIPDVPDTEEAREIRRVFAHLFDQPESPKIDGSHTDGATLTSSKKPTLTSSSSSNSVAQNSFFEVTSNLIDQAKNLPNTLLSLGYNYVKKTTDKGLHYVRAITEITPIIGNHILEDTKNTLYSGAEKIANFTKDVASYGLDSINQAEDYFFGTSSYHDRLSTLIDNLADSITHTSLMQLRPILRLAKADKDTLRDPKTFQVLIQKSDKLSQAVQNLQDLHHSTGILNYLIPLVQKHLPNTSNIDTNATLDALPALQNLLIFVHKNQQSLHFASLANCSDTLINHFSQIHQPSICSKDIILANLNLIKAPNIHEAISKNLPFICLLTNQLLNQPSKPNLLSFVSKNLYPHYQHTFTEDQFDKHFYASLTLFSQTSQLLEKKPDLFYTKNLFTLLQNLTNKAMNYPEEEISPNTLVQYLLDDIKKQPATYQVFLDNRQLFAEILKLTRDHVQTDTGSPSQSPNHFCTFLSFHLSYLDSELGINAKVIHESYLPVLPELMEGLSPDLCSNVHQAAPEYLANIFSGPIIKDDPRFHYDITTEKLKDMVFPWLNRFLFYINQSSLSKTEAIAMLNGIVDSFFFQSPHICGNFLALTNRYNRVIQSLQLSQLDKASLRKDAKKLTLFIQKLLLSITARYDVTKPQTAHPPYAFEPYVNPEELHNCWNALKLDNTFCDYLSGNVEEKKPSNYEKPIFPEHKRKQGGFWSNVLRKLSDTMEVTTSLIGGAAIFLLSCLVSIYEYCMECWFWISGKSPSQPEAPDPKLLVPRETKHTTLTSSNPTIHPKGTACSLDGDEKRLQDKEKDKPHLKKRRGDKDKKRGKRNDYKRDKGNENKPSV